MNPSRDAGRFAYHLKFLLKADLIEADVEARKYLLTELGKMVIDVADKIDKKAFKTKSTLVRTSRPALEEFDANKIANSLVREAQMPVELAQKVAKEAEKQLIHSKTKYLTAPLVREVVNAILIEKGLEEYRHKLTRLGIPVHDVMGLLESKKSSGSHEPASIQELAGRAIFREYALLNIFPRDISDAHLSGALHVNGLSSWILKPTEISHDLRFFIEKGLDLERTDLLKPLFPPPQDLESALDLVFNVCLYSAKEIEKSQTLAYFNVFLAPFVACKESAKIKNALRFFIRNLAQQVDVSLGLELSLPDFLAKKPAFGPDGKRLGSYSDFVEQIQLLASLLLELFAEESERKPLIKPSLIVNIRQESLADERTKALLLKSTVLAAEKGIPYFANVSQKSHKYSIFSSMASRLDVDPNGDWETDTLRTGCLGTVSLNMPRIAYESGKEKTKFIETLKERIEMSDRALEIKHRALKNHGKKLLPFLMQGGDGDRYFRLENCSRIVNLIGFREAVEIFTEKNITDEKASNFTTELVDNVATYIHKISRRRGKQLSPAVMPSFQASERLAQADIEKFGIAKVKFSGTREKPSYSTFESFLALGDKLPSEYLNFEIKIAGVQDGGSMTAIDLGESKHDPSELATLKDQLVQSHVSFWTYDRKMTYCVNCRKSWFGLLRKCPSCGAVGTLTYFDKLAAT
jgi:ribonucleoside-triphosphate reductase